MKPTIYEIIGYTGSSLIAISLLMSNILRLRVLNCIGAILFSLYGLLIKAPAVFLLNAFIAITNIYYIFVLKTKQELFKFIRTDFNDKIFQYFIDYNLKDIKNFFPNFNADDLTNTICFLIIRNLIPVGIVVLKKEGDKAEILVDYVTKEYRDFKNAIKFFSSFEVKKELDNIKEFYITTENKQHIKYLLRIGFKKTEGNKFVKSLS